MEICRRCIIGVEYLQSNMTAGELAPSLHSRTDISKYANGVANAQNMVILNHGGLRRRPGLSKIEDTEVTTTARLLPFIFNEEQDYLIVMKPLFIDVLKDGVLQASVLTTFTIDEIFDVDVIQSADTMIFSHKNHEPKQLQRQGSDTVWEFEPINFDYIPYFNFGSTIIEKYVNHGGNQTVTVEVGIVVLNRDGNNANGLDHHYYKCKNRRLNINLAVENFASSDWQDVGAEEIAWSATRGYPRTCTFFGNRLWFAGTTQRPTTIWGSRVNGFFNFDLGDGSPDLAIQDILDSDQFNVIQRIFGGRALQAFTTGSEFVNEETGTITPLGSIWKQQTGYGSSLIRPILIDGSTLFIDSSRRTVRQFLYDFNESGWISINASLLSSHLITEAKSMSAIKGTRLDTGDYVYIVNVDGNCSSLKYNEK